MGRDERGPLRILAADDSTVMRGVLRSLFDLHASQGDPTLPRMELCGLVRDGVEALEAVRTLSPDVLLLDLEMPRMNGLEVLMQLRVLAPSLPVIMCSAYTERGAKPTLDALAEGAMDYVTKPGRQRGIAAALDSLMEQLLPRIAAFAGAGLKLPARRKPVRGGELERLAGEGEAARTDGSDGCADGCADGVAAPVELVVIGVSTGGPAALELMLPQLPQDFGAPVMIVQHMPAPFTGALAERLNRLCRLPVEQALHGAAVKPGTVLLAPGDAHMEVASASGLRGAGGVAAAVKLHQGVPRNSCKPSVDYLFFSAAALYGPGTLAVMMTGMGADGLDGARVVRAAGGSVLAQDEASSAVWGMPGRVARAGLASAIVPLSLLAWTLTDRVQAGRQARRPLAAKGDREVIHGLL